MITKQQAMQAYGLGEIHYTGRHACACKTGPRGGVTETITRVRVSGKCQTWKTRPNEFRLPVKYGLYESAEITHWNAQDFHLACDCPLVKSAHEATTMNETLNARI